MKTQTTLVILAFLSMCAITRAQTYKYWEEEFSNPTTDINSSTWDTSFYSGATRWALNATPNAWTTGWSSSGYSVSDSKFAISSQSSTYAQPFFATSSNPFPTSGGFTFEARIKFSFVSGAGNNGGIGVLLDNIPITTSMNPVSDSNLVISIWGGNYTASPSNLSKVYARYGGTSHEITSYLVGSISEYHDYKLDFTGTAYTLYVDGGQAATWTSSTAPQTIGIGECKAWGASSWTGMTLDLLRVTT